MSRYRRDAVLVIFNSVQFNLAKGKEAFEWTQSTQDVS